MSVWIRTQDREELLKINNVKTEMLKHGDVRSCHIVCSSYDLQSTSHIIGTYATKERALEVLDEIQKSIRDIEIARIGGVNCHEVPYVYEMPNKKLKKIIDKGVKNEKMKQISMFDIQYPHFYFTKPIRLIELFAGIGSQAKAMKNIDLDFTHYRICEFDKYAVLSYNAIHNTDFKTSDITKINASDLAIAGDYDYVLTYSFPCTDLSLAGKQAGMSKGSGTRSGLLWEVERLLKQMKELPQVLLMENVPDVIGKKNIKDFNEWQAFLESLGYKNYVELLNAKHYGIPQNRNRAFMVSILGDYSYEFPKRQKLKWRLKDFLEEEVDEKYYLSDKQLEVFQKNSQDMAAKGNGFKFAPKTKEELAFAITTKAGSRMNDNFIQEPIKLDKVLQLDTSHEMEGRAYSANGLCPTINTMGTAAKIMIPEAPNKGYALAEDGDGVYINRPHQKRGVVQKQMIQTIKADANDIGVIIGSSQKNAYIGTTEDSSPSLTSAMGQGGGHIPMVVNNARIRKLTPKETWRLMGFTDDDFEKANKVNNNSQLYKQAGNSIVVQVLEAIFKQMKRRNK